MKFNTRLHRANLLLALLESSEGDVKEALEDSLVFQLKLAFDALIVEIADIYRISDKTIAGLEAYNPEMAELRLVTQLLNNPDNWLHQLQKRYQTTTKQAPDSVKNLIVSSTLSVEIDDFYRLCAENMQLLRDQLREQSQFL